MADAELHAALLAVETAVWRALTKGDSAADLALLDPEFLGVYPSGFAAREDHAAQLEDGPSIADFTLSQVLTREIAPDLGLICYHASFRRAASDLPEAMYISSLWRRENGQWRNLFSQDTPIP